MKKTIIIIGVILITIIAVATTYYVIREVDNNKMVGIYVSSEPAKKVYYIDETFDASGLLVYEYLNKGIGQVIPNDHLTFENFDSSVERESLRITIRYQTYTASFLISIVQREVIVPTITSISIEPGFIDTYSVGTRLVDVAMSLTLLITYSDETVIILSVNPAYISGFDSTEAKEDLVLTITYSDENTGLQHQTHVTIQIID